MGKNSAWLAQVVEDALEPDLPICDPHHHLWEHWHGPYDERYLMDDIQEDLRSGGHNVVSSVFIECGTMFCADGPEDMKPVGEVEFANGIAAMAASGLYGKTKVAAGIIGYVDLQIGARARDVLEALMAAAPDRFRGIRRIGAWDDDPAMGAGRGVKGPHLYLDTKFREGFAAIAPLGLTFDAICRHPQLSDIVDLARAFPDTTIVINHLGGVSGIGRYAGRRDEIFAEWKTSIAALAECPNTVIKLGGINMTYCGFGWHEKPVPPTSEELSAATRRYYETAIEAFGPDRCMFESNFPVDKVSCSYNVLWNSFKRITKGCSSNEKAKLFHDTAARVYRLQ